MSNAKDKAKTLVNKYLQVYDGRLPIAKECALIAVDEILNLMIKEFKWDIFNNGHIEYWLEVKQEIEKL